MSKVHYVTCPSCAKRYYLDRLLHEIVISDPKQKLKCPFCKTVFATETPLGKRGADATAATDGPGR
jgi:uncharacterized Zn-finger protein